jgi:hypothetical protein
MVTEDFARKIVEGEGGVRFIQVSEVETPRYRRSREEFPSRRGIKAGRFRFACKGNLRIYLRTPATAVMTSTTLAGFKGVADLQRFDWQWHSWVAQGYCF